MLVLLADGNHGMLASRYLFLANGPIAGNIPWIHTRIIWTLQATLVTIAFIELPGTIGAGCDTSQFQRLIGQSIPATWPTCTVSKVSLCECFCVCVGVIE